MNRKREVAAAWRILKLVSRRRSPHQESLAKWTRASPSSLSQFQQIATQKSPQPCGITIPTVTLT